MPKARVVASTAKLNVKGQETEAGQSKAGALLRGTERKFEKPRMGQRKRLYCEVPKGNLKGHEHATAKGSTARYRKAT